MVVLYNNVVKYYITIDISVIKTYNLRFTFSNN